MFNGMAMLWIVTIKDVQIPVRAASEEALLDQLEAIFDLPLQAVDFNLHALPDLAEMLASSQIVMSRLDGNG
jgi:hypothetical protein